MKLEVGDKFWLLPAPINPLMILVEVLEVTSKGYVVDEPVGLVNNENCIFHSKEDAEVGLRKLHEDGIAIVYPDLDTHDLVGTRRFFVNQCAKLGIYNLPPLKEKQRRQEWFNIEDCGEIS